MENFQEKFQQNITRSLELGIKEPVYRWGPVKITWRPELGTGQIDIIETKGMNFYDLKDFWEQVRTELPEGKWELNPDKAIKDRIYAMLFEGDPQITRSGDEGMRAKGREGFILDNSKFNVNNLEEKELRRFAEKWLTDNPDKTLKEFRIENGYTGPPLKPKQGRGQPIRVSFKNPAKARAYQAARQKKLNEIKLNNPEADAEYILNQEIASEYTDLTDDDLVAQQVTKSKPHVADHGKYPKGGPDDLGRSRVIDPTFNANKQAIEKRVTAFNKKIGSDSISVDLNEVGEIIAGPEATYNAYDPGKSRGWKVIPEGLDTAGIDAQLNSITKSNRRFIQRALGVAATATAGVIASPLKTLAAIPDITLATYAFDALSLGSTQLDKWGTQQLPDDHVYKSGATKQQALDFLNRQIGADVIGLEPTGVGNLGAVLNQLTDPRETEEQKRVRGEQAIQNVKTMQQYGMTPWF